MSIVVGIANEKPSRVNRFEALLLGLLGLLDEPQSAIASTPDTTATGTRPRSK